MSIPKVVVFLVFVCVEWEMTLLGKLGIDVVVKSSPFRLLEVWLSEASYSSGLRYCKVGGVLSVMRADFCGVNCAAWMECLSDESWRELPPRSGETFPSWASMSRSMSALSSWRCRIVVDGSDLWEVGGCT